MYFVEGISQMLEFFPILPVQWHMSICLVTGVNFDNVIEMVSARFLYCKVTFFFFLINQYTVGDVLRLCKI